MYNSRALYKFFFFVNYLIFAFVQVLLKTRGFGRSCLISCFSGLYAAVHGYNIMVALCLFLFIGLVDCAVCR
jgi:hypothetical protein